MDERPTFSPFWHRVRTMKPRLRPHVEITRQRYRGRIWHVVHDPASNKFYRLNPVAYDLVGMLDGSRDVETAWKLSLEKFGDAAPTQNEIIQLISQLYNANLLTADVPPETEQLLRRGRERIKQKITQQAIGIMYFRIRLFNPEPILRAVEPVLRPIINKWGFLAWVALIVFALTRILPRWGELAGGFDAAISPSNWGWLIVVFIVTKAWHELGHGVICKRFGGQVPEFGIMLLVLLPSPYVDASACWGFPNKWKRVAVGAGGMMFELALAAAAALVWLGAEPGTLVRQVCYNAMLTASISTVLFNANPLMRFDGYYILADLLETPNLMQRSTGMLKHIVKKYIYRLDNLVPPTSLPGERVILVVYGVAALAYRVFLFISITLLVMGKLFAVGLILAIWTAGAWFVIPIGGFIHWLATNPQLTEKRARTIAASIAMALGVGALLGAVPMADHRNGMGVVESVYHVGVYPNVEGFVLAAHVLPGDAVSAGDPIITLDNPELVSQRDSMSIQLQEARMQERAALQAGQPGAAMILAERARVLESALAELGRRVEQLVVRAEHDGVIVGSDPSMLVGAFIKRGQEVCGVVDPGDLRIAAVLSQQQAAWLFDLPAESVRTELRPVSHVWAIVPVDRIERIPGGQRVLPHGALGFRGGGDVQLDEQDQSGRVAKQERFTVYAYPDFPRAGDDSAWRPTPGERVKLRFTLPDRPLLHQWWQRLDQLMQGRTKV